MKLSFEKLNEKHLPSILEIEKTTNPSPWSEESFRNELNNAQSIFYAAFLGAEIVGFGGVWKVIDEAHVTTVAVKEEHRRNGYGWELMVRLLEEAKEQGMTCSTLEVRAGNVDRRAGFGAVHLYFGAQTSLLDFHIDFYGVYHGDTQRHLYCEKRNHCGSRCWEHPSCVSDDLPRSIAVERGKIFWTGKLSQPYSRLSFNR